MHFMASNNDCGIREYDMERFQLLNHFRFPWPVNVSLRNQRLHINVIVTCTYMSLQTILSLKSSIRRWVGLLLEVVCWRVLGYWQLISSWWWTGFLQHTSISPDRRLVAVVGDHVDGLLMDSQNGKVPEYYLYICSCFEQKVLLGMSELFESLKMINGWK